MKSLFILHLLLIPGANLLAAYGNFNSVLIGEQASGMGGAYTALSGDSSAIGFYNPAALVLMEGNDISASATLFNKYDTTYGEGSNIVDAGERVNRGFFRTVPSAIGNVYRWNQWAFGFNIVVPDYDFYSGNIANGPGEQSFLTYTDESLWSGVVASYRASASKTFGISLYYTARSLIRSSQDRATLSPSHEIVTTEEKSIKHNGLVMVLGYLWEFSKNWKLGISIRPPALDIAGQGSFFQSVTDTDNLPSQTIQYKNIKASTYIPPRYSLGFSVQATPHLTLSLDGKYYSHFGYRDMEKVDASDNISHQDTWNAAFGMEYEFKEPKFKWRAGVFTNNSSMANIPSSPSERVGDKMDLWGFSSNINFLVSDHSNYTVGGFYSGGNGNSVQKIGNQYVTLDKTHHIFSLLISTSYNF